MQQVTLREERVSRNGMYTVKEMLKGIVTLREERVSRNSKTARHGSKITVTLREERVSRNIHNRKREPVNTKSRSARSV